MLELKRKIQQEKRELFQSKWAVSYTHLRGILTDGGYGDHSQFHYYELKGQELRYKGGADIVCEGKKLLLKQYRFRGSKAVLLNNQERLFCREIL